MTTWPEVPLRRVFRVVNGGTPTGDPTNWEGELPWATPIDLGRVNGGVLMSTDRTLTEAGLLSGSRLVPVGSLVVSTRAPIGYVTEAGVGLAFNQGCRGLVPVTSIDSRYFRYQLSTITSQLESRGQGSTFAELSSDGLASSMVVCPPFAMQRAVADFLDDETALIDALAVRKRGLIELLAERRLSVMAAGVSGQLTGTAHRKPSSLPWLDSLPAHWDEVGLTLVARLGSGHTPSRRRDDWWVESECTIPWITTGEVAQLRSDRVEYIEETRENISLVGLQNSAAELDPEGTVVLCRTAASAGYSGIMRSDMATSQDFATWTCGPLFRPRFLLLCLRAMRNDLLGRLAMGSTHKTIYMPDVQSLRIPLPPVDEQDEIVEATWRQLDRDGEIEDLLVRQIDLLAERRQALIRAAVTGELKIPPSTAKKAS